MMDALPGSPASSVSHPHPLVRHAGVGGPRAWALNVTRYVLISKAVSANLLAAMAGSASGGLSIAQEVLGRHYLEAAQARASAPSCGDNFTGPPSLNVSSVPV
jgi:hypothetical protein